MERSDIIINNEAGTSSFELKKTSKGYSWTIKCYNTDLEQAYTNTQLINEKAVKDYGTLET